MDVWMQEVKADLREMIDPEGENASEIVDYVAQEYGLSRQEVWAIYEKFKETWAVYEKSMRNKGKKQGKSEGTKKGR